MLALSTYALVGVLTLIWYLFRHQLRQLLNELMFENNPEYSNQLNKH